MYKGNKVKTPAIQQQIKCVYVPQKRKWKLHIQWGHVNTKGTFFIVEYSHLECFTDHTKAFKTMEQYLTLADTVTNNQAKPVFSCSSPSVINTDCMSECDMELAEQYANTKGGEGEEPGGNFW